jgi:glycosyltransferase involved in cell wall biosynthesis
VVCREALDGEPLDAAAQSLPDLVEAVTYPDDAFNHLLLRLFFLPRGGRGLSALYGQLYRRHPDAKVIVRHHAHALAAYWAGFRVVRYLVPSLSSIQLAAELPGRGWFARLKILAHIAVDGWAQRRALRWAQLYVFSEIIEGQIRQALGRAGRGRVIASVKPGIDPERFFPPSGDDKSALRQALGLPAEGCCLLFVGRFSLGKGAHYLLRALTDLPMYYSAVFVGEGEQGAALRAQAAALGIGSRVVFAGSTSRVEDYYRAADVFVNPTQSEGFGQTFIEAAACGLRAVAFHQSTGVITATHSLGLDSCIDYATALSGEGLAQAITSAAKNVALGSDRSIAERAHDDYRWSRLLEQLIL